MVVVVVVVSLMMAVVGGGRWVGGWAGGWVVPRGAAEQHGDARAEGGSSQGQKSGPPCENQVVEESMSIYSLRSLHCHPITRHYHLPCRFV